MRITYVHPASGANGSFIPSVALTGGVFSAGVFQFFPNLMHLWKFNGSRHPRGLLPDFTQVPYLTTTWPVTQPLEAYGAFQHAHSLTHSLPSNFVVCIIVTFQVSLLLPATSARPPLF